MDALQTTWAWDFEGKRHAVLVKCSCGGATWNWVDKLDLLSAKERESSLERFCQHIRNQAGAVSEEAKKVWAEEYLKMAAQAAEQKPAGRQPASEAPRWEPGGEAKRQAEKLLADPNLLPRVVDLIEGAGVVGERALAATLYIAGTSRVLKKPIYALVKGAPSTGKSFTQKTVASLFPPSASLSITDATAQSFYYVQSNLSHKVVWLGERKRQTSEEAIDSTKCLRELVENGWVIKQIPRKRPDGTFETITVEVQGPIALVETCSHDYIPEEDQSRQIAVWTNDSPELTRRFFESYAAMKEGLVDNRPSDQELEAWLAAQYLLEPSEVVIPFASEIARRFPAERVECRRAFVLFLAFIEAIAALHYRQRETRNGRIVATPEDGQAAAALLRPWLSTTLPSGVPPSAARAWEWVKTQRGHFRRKDLEKSLGLPERTAREALRELLRREAITSPQKGVYQVANFNWTPQTWELAEW